MNHDFLLLHVFNDLYEDHKLDQPWKAAKLISQMFPDEFYPSSQHHPMHLSKQVAAMFPDQLGNLTSWQELSLPSILVHLAPEKFAPLDFTDLDGYAENDDDDYANPNHVRQMVLAIVTTAHRTLPRVAKKVSQYMSPELEQKLKSTIGSSKLGSLVKKVLPVNQNQLDYEWLYERLVAKIKETEGLPEYDEESQEEEATTPATEAPTTTEAPLPPPTSTRRCPWGPILCSFNRVTFQRNTGKRQHDAHPPSHLAPAPQNTTHSAVVPAWIQSRLKTTPRDVVQNRTREHLPLAIFRRFRKVADQRA